MFAVQRERSPMGRGIAPRPASVRARSASPESTMLSWSLRPEWSRASTCAVTRLVRLMSAPGSTVHSTVCEDRGLTVRERTGGLVVFRGRRDSVPAREPSHGPRGSRPRTRAAPSPPAHP